MLIFINICIAIAFICMGGALFLFIFGVITDRWFKLIWIYRVFFALILCYFIAGSLALIGGGIWGIVLLIA